MKPVSKIDPRDQSTPAAPLRLCAWCGATIDAYAPRCAFCKVALWIGRDETHGMENQR